MNNFNAQLTHFKLIIQVRVNGNERWKCKYHKINRVNVDFNPTQQQQRELNEIKSSEQCARLMALTKEEKCDI